MEEAMFSLSNPPAGTDFDETAPSLTFAALGFVGSTLLTATVMVLLSAL
jgi:hypothetical protein